MKVSIEEYRETNNQYWQSEYQTKYPDTSLVKLYHHRLKKDISPSLNFRVLDYGCSNGTNAFFFSSLGMKVYGVDVNKIAINKAKLHVDKNKLQAEFAAIPFEVSEKDIFFGGNFDFIYSWYTLCYLSNSDLKTRIQSLANQLKPNGLFVASMVGSKTANYAITSPAEDGLRKFPIVDRIKDLHPSEHYCNFIQNEKELISKFPMFTMKHVGYINESFSVTPKSSNNLFHYIFVGQKPDTK